VLALVELKTATLDYGIPGVSPFQMLVIFWIVIAISMIPYLFLFLSLREKRKVAKPAGRFAGWLHWHRHPELLHH